MATAAGLDAGLLLGAEDVVLRPQGLIPSRRRARELTGGELREASVYEVQEHAK